MTDWDASRYHRISAPQFDWGQRVIARLQPQQGERILDLGCGTGRLTSEIGAGLPGAFVVGLDRSGAMLAVARHAAPGNESGCIAYVLGDGAALPFRGVFDAVFSAATLHWVRDHQAVFDAVFAALQPGGRFVAQCGGAGNLHRLYRRADGLMVSSAYRQYFHDWTEPYYFANPERTAERLQIAGFVDVRTWLEDAPVDLGNGAAFAEFVGVVCIRHQLECLPADLRGLFTRELTEMFRDDTPPFVLDYRRLNIDARKARA